MSGVNVSVFLHKTQMHLFLVSSNGNRVVDSSQTAEVVVVRCYRVDNDGSLVLQTKVLAFILAELWYCTLLASIYHRQHNHHRHHQPYQTALVWVSISFCVNAQTLSGNFPLHLNPLRQNEYVGLRLKSSIMLVCPT